MWEYAELTQNASLCGGPEEYINRIKATGRWQGAAIMLPIAIVGYVLIREGTDILKAIGRKQKLKSINVAYLEKENRHKKESSVIYHRCPECGREATNIDEVTVMFGYKSNEQALKPYRVCKRCRVQGSLVAI